jgi:superfamily II DNA or RNA helicase
MGESYLPFDEPIKKLEGSVGFDLKPGQQRAPKELYMSSDLCLITATGFGKTIVSTGYHTLLKPEAGAITIILSTLSHMQK